MCQVVAMSDPSTVSSPATKPGAGSPSGGGGAQPAADDCSGSGAPAATTNLCSTDTAAAAAPHLASSSSDAPGSTTGGQQEQQQQPEEDAQALAAPPAGVGDQPGADAAQPPASSSSSGATPAAEPAAAEPAHTGDEAAAAAAATTPPSGVHEALQQLTLSSTPATVEQPQPQPADEQPAQPTEPQPAEQQQPGGEEQPLAEQPQPGEEQPPTAPDGSEEHATLFFAKVPRSASRDQVEQLFASFGDVVSLNLFVPYEGAPASKGCGLVVMRNVAAAQAAIAGLESFTWEGMHSAMVLKLMVPGVQRQRPDGSSGASPQAGGGNRSPSKLARPLGMHSALSGGVGGRPGAGAHSRTGQSMDVPPAGCSPDAYKLFVGNIPRVFMESDLLPIFESIGPVRELVVLRDRQTHESKGSAFVWYATGSDADNACLQFNLRLVLQTPGGPSASRPLVVRRAVAQRPGGQMLLRQQQPGHMGDMLAGGGMPGAPLMAAGALLPGDSGAMHTQQPAGGGYMTPGVFGGYMDPRYAAAAPQGYGLMQQQQLWQQQAAGTLGSPAGAAGMQVPAFGYAAAAPEQLQHHQGGYMQQQQPLVMAASSGLTTQAPYMPAGQQQLDVAGGPYGQQQLLVGGSSMPVSAGIAYAQDGQQQHVGMLAVASSQAGLAAGQGGYTHQHLMGHQAGPAVVGAAGSPPLGSQQPQLAHLSGSPQHGRAAVAGGAPHSLSIPLSPAQLSLINPQLGSVSVMSGATINMETDLACGGLALVVTAASQQQLAVAWQLLQGMLRQSGGGSGAGQPEVMA